MAGEVRPRPVAQMTMESPGCTGLVGVTYSPLSARVMVARPVSGPAAPVWKTLGAAVVERGQRAQKTHAGAGTRSGLGGENPAGGSRGPGSGGGGGEQRRFDEARGLSRSRALRGVESFNKPGAESDDAVVRRPP